MASPIRIKDIPTTATSTGAGDFLVVDGPTGTRKITPEVAAAAAVAGHTSDSTAHSAYYNRARFARAVVSAVGNNPHEAATDSVTTATSSAASASLANVYTFGATESFFEAVGGFYLYDAGLSFYIVHGLSETYPVAGGVRFMTDAASVEIKIDPRNTGCAIDIYVDRRFVQRFTSAAAGVRYHLVTFTGAKMREVEFRCSSVHRTGYLAVSCPADGKIWKPATRPAILELGDSYASGAGATIQEDGYNFRLGRMLGCSYDYDCIGGTGYVANAEKNYQLRAAAYPLTSRTYSAVIVQSSRNDLTSGLTGGATNAQVCAAALVTWQTLRAKFPTARIYVTGIGGEMGISSKPAHGVLETALAAQFTAWGDPNSIFIPWFQWFDDAHGDYYTSGDNVHPSEEGHAMLANRTAEIIREDCLKF